MHAIKQNCINQPRWNPAMRLESPGGKGGMANAGTDDTERLDGRVAGLRRLLSEMAALMVDTACEDGEPILTLQFGEIVTKTAISTFPGPSVLVVTALLPSGPQQWLTCPASQEPEAGELLWDSDGGRPVLVRHIRIESLGTERAALDAILDTVDRAEAWLSLHVPPAAGN